MSEWKKEFQYLLDRKILTRDELGYLFGQIKSINDSKKLDLQSQLTAAEKENADLEQQINMCIESGAELGDQIIGEHDQTKKRLAAAEEKLRWIPVGERLPEHNQEVIVFAKNSYWYCRKYKTKDGFGSGGMEGFHNIGSTMVMPTMNVTHWRPITLPKKDEVKK